MDIQHTNTGKNGYFRAIEHGKEAGRMTYKWSEKGKMIIKHTTVHNAFKGQGVGKELVMAAVDYARLNAIKITPVCRYAKSVFEKTEEIKDVLSSR
jgi:predicted GNAT family acetyltransferase